MWECSKMAKMKVLGEIRKMARECELHVRKEKLRKCCHWMKISYYAFLSFLLVYCLNPLIRWLTGLKLMIMLIGPK